MLQSNASAWSEAQSQSFDLDSNKENLLKICHKQSKDYLLHLKQTVSGQTGQVMNRKSMSVTFVKAQANLIANEVCKK